MIKFLKVVSFIILVVAIAGVTYVVANFNDIIKESVERTVPDIIGAPVKIGKVQISLMDGKGTVEGVVIGNPSGFDSKYAVMVERIDIDMPLQTLLDEPATIKLINITSPKINYEVGVNGSNIDTLAQNAAGGSKSTRNTPNERRTQTGKSASYRTPQHHWREGKAAYCWCRCWRESS